MTQLPDSPGDANCERIRNLCLTYPETSEKQSWAHPAFQAGSRTFVTLESHAGRTCVAIRLVADQVRELCEEKNFFPTPYGKGQWASHYLDGRVNWRLLSQLIDESYRHVALQRMLQRLDASSSRNSNKGVG
jgi:predicted DNA-binding protein (MmcQ/YjbR family)